MYYSKFTHFKRIYRKSNQGNKTRTLVREDEDILKNIKKTFI